MAESTIIILVCVCVFMITVLLCLWINVLTQNVNALAARVRSLELQAMTKANDPVANFKTL